MATVTFEAAEPDAQALDTWHLALDTWHLILDTWYLIHDTWHLILDTWHLTLETWHLILDTWYLILDTWYLILDTWYLILDTWYWYWPDADTQTIETHPPVFFIRKVWKSEWLDARQGPMEPPVDREWMNGWLQTRRQSKLALRCFLLGKFGFVCLFVCVGVWTNQKNSGWTSVDRSTKATLSTYNTWIHVSRLQKIYQFQSSKLRLSGESGWYATGPRPKGLHVTMKVVDNTA